MDTLMIAIIAVHALSGVFWAGSTSAMAQVPGGQERLLPFQMVASGITVLTGIALWAYWRGAAVGTSEIILLVGIASAIVAGAVQGTLIGGARRALKAATGAVEQGLRERMVLANRIAAGFLMITVVTMVTNRFF